MLIVRRLVKALGSQIRHMIRWDAGAVLAVTVSVQGIVIGSQFLAAFLVSPEELGAIRWLESAFVILLLVASCGMPSVAFREAALCEDSSARRHLFVKAVWPTLAFGFLIVMSGCLVYLVAPSMFDGGLWVMLLVASGVILPANVARVGIAMIQGAQVARSYWHMLLVLAFVGIALLVWATFSHGIQGWIVGRYVEEGGLALFVATVFLRRVSGLNCDFQRSFSARSLLRFGVAANFALIIRAFCDSLPILLLKSSAIRPVELGLFGFAGLLLFAPLLLMSVFMQLHTPKLVVLHRQPRQFKEALGHMRNVLLTCAGFGVLAIALFGLGLRFIVTSAYAESVSAIFMLAGTLPFRAVIMTGGAALVACGRNGTSSIVTFSEIIVIVIMVILVEIGTASAMAALVLSASIASAFLAVFFIHWNDRFLIDTFAETS